MLSQASQFPAEVLAWVLSNTMQACRSLGTEFPSCRAGVHAPTKAVSVLASIWLSSPVQPRSGVHTDKIAIGACKAVNFVSYREQSTWLPCGMGGFVPQTRSALH